MWWVIVIVEFKVPGKGDLLFKVTQLLSWPNCRRSWYIWIVYWIRKSYYWSDYLRLSCQNRSIKSVDVSWLVCECRECHDNTVHDVMTTTSDISVIVHDVTEKNQGWWCHNLVLDVDTITYYICSLWYHDNDNAGQTWCTPQSISERTAVIYRCIKSPSLSSRFASEVAPYYHIMILVQLYWEWTECKR